MQPVTIGDFVWHDLDADGTQDGDETGAASVRVHLLAADGSPARHVDGSNVEPVLTGLDGSYSFENIRPGEVFVAATFDGEWESSPLGVPDPLAGAADSDLDPDTGESSIITVTSGQVVDALDIGVWRTSSIGDRVFLDVNGNGVQDTEEPGVAEVVLTLFDGAGDAIATTTSDGSGDYRFVGLAPGAYTVQVDPDNGLVLTSPNVGLDPELDSDADPITGEMATVAILSATNLTGQDAGVLERPFLAGRVFVDGDGDGVLDPIEPGIANVTIRLQGNDIAGRPVDLTVDTDAAGRFRFDSIEPSDDAGYSVTEVQPAGWFDGLDSGPDGAVIGDDVVSGLILRDGQPALGINFGELPAASISGEVYVDHSLDGNRQSGEPPIGGVQIVLSGTDDLGAAVDRIELSAADGSVLFASPGHLPPDRNPARRLRRWRRPTG